MDPWWRRESIRITHVAHVAGRPVALHAQVMRVVDSDPGRSVRGGDVVRQVVVAASALVAIAGLAVGAGGFGGTGTADASGGAFAATATLIAPAGPAFSIWSVIYLGLLALGVWQLAPGRRTDSRQRRTGWLVAVTMLANTAWILVVQAGLVWLSVVVIVVLLLALVAVYAGLLESPPTSRWEGVLLDGTMGLYLGWVSIATAANVAAASAASGWSPGGVAGTTMTIALIGIVTVIGVAVGRLGRGRWAFSIALAWGLLWVSIGRWSGPPRDTAIAVAALVAAALVVMTPTLVRRDHANTAV